MKWEYGQSSVKEIRNTQIYDFSPIKSLFSDQQYIVDEILKQINEGTHKVFVIQGDPGSYERPYWQTIYSKN